MDPVKNNREQQRNLREYADIIEKYLQEYGIQALVTEIDPNPPGIQFCLKVALGTKVSKILKHEKGLGMIVAAPHGRVSIEAPIPGRDLIGITIPNVHPYPELLEPPQPKREGRIPGQLYMEIAAYFFRLSEKMSGKPIVGDVNVTPDPYYMRDIFDDIKAKRRLKIDARIIECTYEAFGIPVQITEIDILQDWYLFTAVSKKSVDAKDLMEYEKDLALSLATKTPIVVKAPLPGKDAFGVYVPRVLSKNRTQRITHVSANDIRGWTSMKLLGMSEYFFRSVEQTYFKPLVHKYSVLAQYKKQLKPLNNEQLIEAYNKEVENSEQSWTRPYFIAAMQMSLERNNIDYEAIAGYPNGLSLKQKATLVGKKIVI